MNLRPFLFACMAAIAAAASAEPWTKVDELPGGIAVEIDENSQIEALDGVQMVEQATFRRQLPNGTLETAVAADCAHGTAKIRGVRLVDQGKTVSQNVNDKAPYEPVHQGSSEAIYFKALCSKEAPPPEPPADAETGEDGAQ
jgi:hypothetical protein